MPKPQLADTATADESPSKPMLPDDDEGSADLPERAESSPQSSSPGTPDPSSNPDAGGEEVAESLADPVFAEPPGDFFDGGMEDAPDEDFEFSPADDAADEDENDDDASDAHSFETSINRGFARLAVIGIEDDDQKEDLRGEFREVFEEFQLGHYGNEVVHEYLMVEDDDIDPIWGFTGALVACVALVIYMRPDGDEIVDDFSAKLGGLGSRVKGAAA